MNILLVIGGLLLVLFLVFGFLFVGLVLPVWTVIHCATSSASVKTKTLWIIVMLLFWPLGAWAYALFVSKKPLFQWSVAAACSLLVLLVGVVAASLPEALTRETQRGSAILLRVDQLDMPGTSSTDRQEMQDAMAQLQQELNGSRWLKRYQHLERVGNLHDLFEVYARDAQFTSTEWRGWMEMYHTRDLIDQDALKDTIRGLKAASVAAGLPAPASD